MLENYVNGKIYMMTFGTKVLIGKLKKDEIAEEYILKSVADVITLDIPVENRDQGGRVVQGVQVVYYMIPLGEISLNNSITLCQVTSDSPVYASYYQNILKLDIKMAVPSDVPSNPLQRK